ncbi:aminoglycoside phosphotransferase family protein [Burkholderia sp. L27(2015)]|uniref:aminoglycoside phosphotransferase family protein n=1 Tax=Burkholderia sp. L27(2015) TaxID=1641858 RepID=UPI00131D177B|nr:aminoglycoside phosphotransferase family protein [Burkholderia sp. L27(2015)]
MKNWPRQVEIVAEAACLDRHRLLAWIASWAALSAAWHVEEDVGKPDAALAVAETVLNELGLSLHTAFCRQIRLWMIA